MSKGLFSKAITYIFGLLKKVIYSGLDGNNVEIISYSTRYFYEMVFEKEFKY